MNSYELFEKNMYAKMFSGPGTGMYIVFMLYHISSSVSGSEV